ncbi:MAG TPA: hypothetical protein VMM12_08590 [Longimicrobiales bacterium]|nr:hypothetical protein [Longimicrobiales bacterium]
MTRSIRTLFLPLAAVALAVGACDDPTEVESHPEADGIAIMAGEAELYRYMLDDGSPPPFTLAAGTYDVAFVLLDANGDPLPHEEGEEGEELSVTTGDAAILTWTPEAEAPGDVHAFEEFHGELNALQAGSTTLEVCLLHAGHCDFEAVIPVTVT